ncbi:MAG: pantetheine-phosphate adenylyltransferase [Bacteroidota bacterium]
MSKRIALFPGSFDPITFGHIEIVKRGLEVFDEIVVGLGINTQKKTMFTPEQRLSWIARAFADEDRVKISQFEGLTVRFAREVGAQFLLRGLRDQTDFVYEKNINFLNKHLEQGIETVFLVSDPSTQTISSSLVREIIHFEGKLEGLIPDFIVQEIYS